MQPELAALPAVELRRVVVGDVVQHDEDLRVRVFDDGGQRALPAEVLAAERQPPALSQPVPAIGECGARSFICAGSMFDP